jgi:hypothetical protein
VEEVDELSDELRTMPQRKINAEDKDIMVTYTTVSIGRDRLVWYWLELSCTAAVLSGLR